MERQTREIDAGFATRDDGAKRIEGYFAVFGPVYELWPGATESIDPHAFDGALGDDIRCLIDHDTRLVLGRNRAHTLELRTDSQGLFGSVLINEADQDAMNAYARAVRGDVSQASFGFDILDQNEEIRADGSVHWTIRKVKLYEVSLVTFPAYKETSLQARRQDWDAIQQRRKDYEAEQLRAWRQERLDRIHIIAKRS